jgi:chromosome partitioning protein
MTVIAVANQKGGVGKTTTVANLGAALQEKGYRVLLVDNDPQANLAVSLGIPDPEALEPTLGDLLIERAHNKNQLAASHAVFATPTGLDLLPSNTRLSAADLVLVGAIGREMIMRDLLAPLVPEYDFVLIDCLPSLGLLTINALTAADGVLIPVQADYLALQGLAQMLETIAAVRAKLNPGLKTLGALLTMMDVRTAHARGVAELLREALADQVRVFDARVRVQVALKDSAQEGVPILRFRPESQAAAAYRALADEMLEALDGAASGSSGQIERELAAVMAGESPVSPVEALAQFSSFIAGRESWLGQAAL